MTIYDSEMACIEDAHIQAVT